MRAWAGVLAAVAALVAAVAQGAVAAEPGPCDVKRSVCRHVTVPLDRGGKVPGTIRLRVLRVRAVRPERPPLLILPSQAGASTLLEHFVPNWAGFGPTAVDLPYGGRRRDAVLIDLRGTGGSGALKCDGLQDTGLGSGAAVADCAASLGPAARHYSLADSVADIEAVRKALGLRRFAVFGDRFGATLALAYARRHPSSVERLLLQSPLGPHAIDPFFRAGLRAAPRLLRGMCAGRGCRMANGPRALDHVRALRGRLRSGPLTGTVPAGDGTSRPATASAFDIFEALASPGSDLFGFPRLPGDLQSAAKGDFAPLLRAVASSPSRRPLDVPPSEISAAAAVAQLCQSVNLPWRAGAPVAARSAGVARAVSRLPAREFGPFGRGAGHGSRVVVLCREWPAAGRVPPPRRRLPDVPALVVTGNLSLLGAPSVAREVASRFRRGAARVFGGHWNTPLSDDPTGCVGAVVGDFIDGRRPGRGSCNGNFFIFRFPAAPPASLDDVDPVGRDAGKPGRTLAAVRLTARDAAWALERSTPTRTLSAEWTAGALRAGSYAWSSSDPESGSVKFTLRSASFVPGVTVAGSIDFSGEESETVGSLEVSGPAAAPGTLTLRGTVLSGTLGGVGVSAALPRDFLFYFGVDNGY